MYIYSCESCRNAMPACRANRGCDQHHVVDRNSMGSETHLPLSTIVSPLIVRAYHFYFTFLSWLTEFANALVALLFILLWGIRVALLSSMYHFDALFRLRNSVATDSFKLKNKIVSLKKINKIYFFLFYR